MYGDGVPDPGCEEGAKEWIRECERRGIGLDRPVWKMAEIEEVVESVEVAEVEVAEPKVRLSNVEKVGEKRGRVGEKREVEREVEEVRNLIDPLGQRGEFRGLLRRVGKECAFA